MVSKAAFQVECQYNRMSKSQRNTISPAHADDPANPTTHPRSTMEFNEEELKVIKILNETSGRGRFNGLLQFNIEY